MSQFTDLRMQRLQIDTETRRWLPRARSRTRRPLPQQLRLPGRNCVVCTSWSCASSASVFSPLSAAKATLALNVGLWLRRDGSLLLRGISAAFRESTYRTVQIRPATSDFIALGRIKLLAPALMRPLTWAAVSRRMCARKSGKPAADGGMSMHELP